MQDGIGDWHDWLQLTAYAEKLFGGVQDSSLVAQLHNVTRAKYREAVRVLNQTKSALGPQGPKFLCQTAGGLSAELAADCGGLIQLDSYE